MLARARSHAELLIDIGSGVAPRLYKCVCVLICLCIVLKPSDDDNMLGKDAQLKSDCEVSCSIDSLFLVVHAAQPGALSNFLEF